MLAARRGTVGSALTTMAMAFGALVSLRPACAAPGVPEVRSLSNGLQLVILEDHVVPLVASSLWVHAGSKQEIETSAGYAHFLEHMIQRGTDQAGSFEYQKLAQRWGGSLAVHSSYDRLQLTASGVPSVLPDLIQAMAGMVFRATLKDSEIDQELGSLNQEIRSYYNEPVSVAFLETMRATFPGHPYHHPMLGNFRTLGTLRHDPLASFYKNLYVPNNMVLVITGDADPKRATSLVEAAFGKESRSATLAPQPPPPEGFTGHADIEKRLDVKETWVNLSFAGPAYRSPDRAAFDLLARALGDANGAPIEAALMRARAGSAARVASYDLEDASMLYVALQASTPQLSYQAARSALEEIVAFKTRGLRDTEMRSLVERTMLEENLQAQDLVQRATKLGEAALFGGIRYYWGLPEVYHRLTREDIARVAAKYLVSDNCKLVMVLPKETPPLSDQSKEEFRGALDRLGASPQGRKHDLGGSRYAPAEATAASPRVWGDPRDAAGLKPPERVVLGNGLTVVVQEDHRVPLAAIALTLTAGSGDDPPGKAGLASLAGRLIATGMSASARPQGIRQAENRPLAPPEIEVSRDLIEARSLAQPEGLRSALTLLAEVVRHPPMEETAVAAARKANVDALDRSARDATFVALELFHEKVYADHSYGHPASGTASGLQSTTRDDLVDFFARCVRPSTTLLALAGDVVASDAIKTARAVLGDWEDPSRSGMKTIEPRPQTAASPSGSPRARAGEFARTVEAPRSLVLVGVPGAPLGSPDFESLRLIGTALTLRAFEDMVFARRAAFSALAMPEGLRSAGSLALEVMVAPLRRQEAVFDLQRLMRQITLEELTGEEIDLLERVQAGREAAALQGVRNLANTLAYREAAGLGALSYRRSFTDPSRPDPARVKEVASRYLQPDAWIVITAGPASP